MQLQETGRPLQAVDLPRPEPGPGQVRIRVAACAVCRTDLHIVDGELDETELPLVPGHEIVGTVDALGPDCKRFHPGDRVGVPWLGHACGACRYCNEGRENLCGQARFTGYHLPGGYAEYTVAREDYCLAIPDAFDDLHAAPLLCAGLIGYRAWAMTGNAHRVGFYGFGAAAHILCQIAVHENREIHAFTRPGDTDSQAFARKLGAAWAGGSDESPPEPLDAAIIFAPAGPLVPVALKAVVRGGAVVCAGIHMSDIPGFPYADLWGERCIRSVANLTRADGKAFMDLAPQVPVHTSVTPYELEDANRALDDLRAGRLSGAAVLVP